MIEPPLSEVNHVTVLSTRFTRVPAAASGNRARASAERSERLPWWLAPVAASVECSTGSRIYRQLTG